MKNRFLLIILCLCTLIYAERPASAQALTEPTASPTSAQSAAIMTDEYIAQFTMQLDSSGIKWRRLSDDDPYTLVINSAIILEATSAANMLASVDITAQGDFSAISAEIIASVLSGAVSAYSKADSGTIWSELLGLISSAGGTEYAYGLEIALSLTNEAIEMTLTPSAKASTSSGTNVQPTYTISDINGLIKFCADLLPEDWTQTSYQNIGEHTDVLLNIYALSSDTDALWECAHIVCSEFWQAVEQFNLECNRLSIVFYSESMTPMLSLGIGRGDAIDNPLLTSAVNDAEFRQEFERLAAESDALVVSYG